MAFTELNVNGARVSNVGTPTENTDAANKQYVDEHGGNVTAGNGITVDGGVVSVKPKTGGGIIVDAEGVSVDAATMPVPDDAAPTNDPTFTGSVTVPDPTADTDATNKEYVDGAISAAIKNVKVPTAGTGLEQTPEGAFNVKAKASGGIIVGTDGVSVDPDTLPVPEGAAPTNNPTFTGNVTVPEPASDTDAATKGYVDSKLVINDNVVIANSDGVFAKSSFNVDEQDNILCSIVPLYIGKDKAYFTINVFNPSNKALTFSINSVLSVSITDVSLIVADLASPYSLVDASHLYVRDDEQHRLNIGGTMIGWGIMTVQF